MYGTFGKAPTSDAHACSPSRRPGAAFRMCVGRYTHWVLWVFGMLPRAVAGTFGFAFFVFGFFYDLFPWSTKLSWLRLATWHTSDRPRTCRICTGLLALRSTQCNGGNMDETEFEAASKMKKFKGSAAC